MKAKVLKAHGSHNAACFAGIGNSGMEAGHLSRRIYVNNLAQLRTRAPEPDCGGGKQSVGVEPPRLSWR